MRTDKPIRAAALLLALALGGCSLAPQFSRPEAPVAAAPSSTPSFAGTSRCSRALPQENSSPPTPSAPLIEPRRRPAIS